MTKLSKMHKPQLPICKPDKDKVNTVLPFVTKQADKEKSNVILTTEQYLFSDMLQWLSNKKYRYKVVEGGYRLKDGTNKFVVEKAVIVRREIAVLIWAYGWIDTQESVLHLYHRDIIGRYKAELVFINDVKKESIDLGFFVQSSKSKALDNPDGYTYRPDTDCYYITVEI